MIDDLAAYGLEGLHLQLAHVITEYDRKQSKRKGYNPNALGIMLCALDDVFEDVVSGKRGSIAGHICNYFNDRVRGLLLEAVHEWKESKQRQPAS